MRRLVLFFVLVACAGLTAAAAERATFILSDGERKSGTVVFHGDQRENLINGYLNLGVENGKDMTFPMDQVTVIDFVGGQPPTVELSQLQAGHMLVLRNGSVQQGRLLNMTGGDTLFWENTSRQRQQYAIRDVSRVYLNPQAARATFNYVAPAAPAEPAQGQQPRSGNPRGGGNQRGPGGQTDQGGRGGMPDDRNRASQRGDDRRMQPLTVRLDGQQAWTDTGISVSRGDLLSFEPSDPSRDVLARVGNGQVFGVGRTADPIEMRESGRLMLGTDEAPRSRRGALTVRISEP